MEHVHHDRVLDLPQRRLPRALAVVLSWIVLDRTLAHFRQVLLRVLRSWEAHLAARALALVHGRITKIVRSHTFVMQRARREPARVALVAQSVLPPQPELRTFHDAEVAWVFGVVRVEAERRVDPRVVSAEVEVDFVPAIAKRAFLRDLEEGFKILRGVRLGIRGKASPDGQRRDSFTR